MILAAMAERRIGNTMPLLKDLGVQGAIALMPQGAWFG